MKKFGRAGSTLVTVLAAAIVLAIVSTTGAVAGSLITSKRIKNNTIKSIDVRNEALKGIDVKNGSLTGAEIADGSLTGAEIANGSLSSGDFTSAPAGVVRGYVYSGNPDPELDTPVDLTASDYAYNSAGGAITRTRTGVGEYTVNFAGLDLSAGNVQVSSYGEATETVACKVVGWGGSSADIACFTTGGAAANTRFTLAFIR